MVDLWAFKLFDIVVMRSDCDSRYITVKDNPFPPSRVKDYKFIYFESLTKNTPWNIGDVIRAKCLCDHREIGDTHTCGVYSISDLSGDAWRDYASSPFVRAMGLVKLYGNIRVGKIGYISESASLESIVSITLPEITVPREFESDSVFNLHYWSIRRAVANLLKGYKIPFTPMAQATHLVEASNQHAKFLVASTPFNNPLGVTHGRSN